jgi:hypothetical protein
MGITLRFPWELASEFADQLMFLNENTQSVLLKANVPREEGLKLGVYKWGDDIDIFTLPYPLKSLRHLRQVVLEAPKLSEVISAYSSVIKGELQVEFPTPDLWMLV